MKCPECRETSDDNDEGRIVHKMDCSRRARLPRLPWPEPPPRPETASAANADHVVMDMGGSSEPLLLSPLEQLPMQCLNCGEKYVLVLPASVSIVAAVGKQFTKQHRRCKPRNPGGDATAETKDD
jgi:hypothetical protein